MIFRRARLFLSAALMLCGAAGIAGAQTAGAPVVLIPVTGTVDDGMAHLIQRSVDQAEREGAQAIVLEVNSPGGILEDAFASRDAILNASVPTYAFVNQRAYSSAALITLSAKKIYMAPGASIGEAEPAPKTPKLISAVKAEFESTAQRNHRDPHIVAAMVDSTIDLPRYKQAGQNLTLDTQDALQTKIADGQYDSLSAMLAANKLTGPLQTAAYSFAENVARFATDPTISGILLTLGMLGLLIEMQTLHGIAGAIGIGSFALFFGAHFYAGFSNGLVIVLAIAGMALILYELHIVPGHGLPGVAGVLMLGAAILLAFGLPYLVIALQTVATAVVLTVILFSLAVRMYPQNAWMARLTLASAQGAEYVTSSDFSRFLGENGTAASYLRPAGVAVIDGRRLDVLTQGEFIPAGTPVKVTRIEGARIFVEPFTSPQKELS